MATRSCIPWLLAIVLITGCSSGSLKKSNPGGFFGGDSAPKTSNRDFNKIPDAVPKREPYSQTGNKKYSVFGKTYRPMTSSRGYVKTGTASWYGTKFHGNRTSSGEIYDMWKMTAAHTVLPLPTYVEVTNLETGKKIVVKVNDRGPFLHNRLIDLSYAAAHKLGIANRGTGRVQVKAINPDNYNNANANIGGAIVSSSSAEVGTPDTHTDTDNADYNLDEETTVYSGQTHNQKNYFVQIGAYSDAENAIEMRNELRKQGHAVYPELDRDNLSSGIPYRVQVGPFDMIDNALRIKLNLERLLGQTLLLITK